MTPLMQQYWQIKSAHNDKVLLFRMGDFYEMFHKDAETAAPILGIALTSRNKKAADETKMCGVPYHSIAGPIAKLLAAGFKVAICDQIEDPATAKGIVKRAVTRVLSPGMVYDPATLDQLSGNYLCAYDEQTVSFLEPTTGDAFYYLVQGEEPRERLWQLLQPKELILTALQRRHFSERKGTLWPVHLTVVENQPELENKHLPASALRLVEYAIAMQGAELRQTLRDWQRRDLSQHLELSPATIRHLELLNTYKGDRRGSLLNAVDHTKTAAGARLLKHWLQFPLIDLQQIHARQEQIAFWIVQSEGLKAVRAVLATMGDIERRLGKIANPNCNSRDFLALAQSLRAGLTVAPLCPPQEGEHDLLNLAKELVEQMERELVEEPPLSIRQAGLFRRGVTANLDELMDLTEDAQKLLLDLESRERELSGIGSLKVRFNNVFGYYLEVTNTHTHKVPSRYQRKQTLANAERFTTPELNELENKLLSAHAKRAELEYEMFISFRAKILQATADLLQLARRWSELDVFTALAWLAIERKYVRPQFSKAELKLLSSRHAVVEQEVKMPFVPNDIHLKNGDCLLLTGPNMAGKSTLMRQVAVTAILAQMGSFVPAASAILPRFTHIFTRIGASDFLAEGLSTFMVEMKETAEILSQASESSLVILDEIGRGTSTYDGLSLAQSILEYLLTSRKALTLFATHYHELTSLSGRYNQIHNAHMLINEKGGDIHFLHTLRAGPANKSYGIQVAKLAGLPNSVIARAKVLLQALESGMDQNPGQLTLSPTGSYEPLQESASDCETLQLLEQIRQAAVQKMTPLEALNQIAQWQRSLS